MASLIPSGQTSFPLVSGKSVQGLTIVVSTDSDTNPTAPTYTSTALVQDSINNSFTKTLNAGDFALVHTTDMNTTTKQCDPMAVKLVGNYCTGTNSHSKYKGNQLVPTGKVNVGNGSNGFESRVLENANIVNFSQQCILGVAMDVAIGETVYVDNTFPLAVEGMYRWWHTSALISWTPNTSTAFNDPTLWIPIYIGSTPSHSTLTLDNSNSPAVKFIESIATDEDGMAHYQVFAQDMVWDYDNDSWVDGGSLLTDNTTSSHIKGAIYKVNRTDSPLHNMLVLAFNASAVTQRWDLQYINSNGEIYARDGGINTIFKVWDGNGFGDNNQFTQLTNGTTTDDNGNPIKTIVASKPLNKYFRRA